MPEPDHTYTAAHDDLQIGRGIDDLFANLGPAAHDHCIVGADDLEQLLRGDLVLDVNFEASLAHLLNCARRNGITYEYFHVWWLPI